MTDHLHLRVMTHATTTQYHPELGTRYLKSSGAAAGAICQKSSGAADCRNLNKKVAPLPLLTYKTAAGAAYRRRYFRKISSKKNDGIQVRYPIVKFQLYLRKLSFKLLKYWYWLQSALASRLKR